jgi:hypothetical protein
VLNVGSPLGERLLPHQVTAGLTTRADQIRALAQAGYLRTEIASQLDIRYQYVRQVLERSGISLGRQQGGGAPASPRTRSPVKTRRKPEPVVVSEAVAASRLVEAGFVRIGQWTSISGEAFELDCIVPAEAGVYAFVVDGIIRYIGLTQRGLRGRMAHYVRGHVRQRTSARVKGLILAALGAGSKIEVLIATPEPSEWNGLPVLTAPGLEAGLIRMIQPEWNMQGLGR